MGCKYPYVLENKIKEEFNKKYKLIAGKEFFEGVEYKIYNDFINIVQEYNNGEDYKKTTNTSIQDYVEIEKEDEKSLIILGLYNILDMHLSNPNNKNIKFVDNNTFQIFIRDNKWDITSFNEIKQLLLDKVIKSIKLELELNPNSEYSHASKYIIDDFNTNVENYLHYHNDELIGIIKKHCS
jgi:hypothetical protein